MTNHTSIHPCLFESCLNIEELRLGTLRHDKVCFQFFLYIYIYIIYLFINNFGPRILLINKYHHYFSLCFFFFLFLQRKKNKNDVFCNKKKYIYLFYFQFLQKIKKSIYLWETNRFSHKKRNISRLQLFFRKRLKPLFFCKRLKPLFYFIHIKNYNKNLYC